jgi:hypothetical protein
MSTETQKTEVQAQDEVNTGKKLVDPFDFLQTFPNAPSKVMLESWKAQAPNGVIRLFAPGNGKRVYLVRGLNGLELKHIQAQIPENTGANLTPEARSAKIETELALLVGSKAVVWTSVTPDNKLSKEQLESGPAGLPSTLFNLVTYLSDFLDPEAIQLMSAEL